MRGFLRARFWLSYFVDKLALLWTVRTPKLQFFIFEWRYSLANLLNTIKPGTAAQVFYFGPEVIQTRTGSFKVRPGTQDAAIVSPAFEAPDIRFLKGLIERNNKERVDFGILDIGANIGTFSVRAALLSNCRLWVFEPVPANMALLKENFAINQIEKSRVHFFELALSDQTGSALIDFQASQSGNSTLTTARTKSALTIQTARGDEILKGVPDDLIVKIDVEGHEVQVLRGLKQTIATSKQCWLCIEDISDQERLYSELQSMGFQFQKKLTPYNSWWMRNRL